MNTTEGRSSDQSTRKADLKLEVVVISVSDVDRAKQFYGNLGWRLDADFPFENGFRVVQFTPPGSGGSVQFGTKITSAAPGSAQGTYLVVSDIEEAHAELVGRGVPASGVFHFGAADDYWIGSADMMHRNLDRRIEALVRVGHPDDRATLRRMLDHAFSDQVSAWELRSDGRWERRTTGAEDVRLSDYQHDLMAEAVRRGHR